MPKNIIKIILKGKNTIFIKLIMGINKLLVFSKYLIDAAVVGFVKCITFCTKVLTNKIWHFSKNISKIIHNATAKKLHKHYQQKWDWYYYWHEWDGHPKVHYAVLAVYLLIVGGIVFSSYQSVRALSDLSTSWDFSTPSDFTFSSGVEANGTYARLKAQNYSTDANTAALYHFDELSGSTASDSSGNSNNLTLTNSSFVVGNLNNAVGLNGGSSYLSVPDSSSVSLSQQNSIEAWTKLSNNFSPTSSSKRQGIVDKGDYQLYYDNETGKVTYELADGSSTGWNQEAGGDVNSSWDTGGKRSVNSVIKMGSNIYAGIGVDIGDAAVWKWDGTTWTRIGGGPSSVNSSWAAQTFEGVYSLTTDGTNLYAGLGLTAGDAEVWKFNGTTWTKIGGDAINSSWAINTFEQVWTLDYFNGTLYAGIGSSANDAEVWSWNGSTWTKIGGDSLNSGWTTNYEMVASLTNDGTKLYAGLGLTAGDAEVWSWNGSTWTKIGGDGLNVSWNTSYETVRSLRYFGAKLYAGLGDTAGDAEVWEYNGTSWTMIGGDAINSSWANTTYEQVGSFAYDGTNLYAGLGISNGDGEVWKWNGSSWTKIGGDGLSSSWPTNSGDLVNTLLYDSGTLYAGTYDSAGSGWVYTYDGSNWSLIGGDYVNQSWGFYGFNAVQVMQNVGDYLYAGLGNTAGSAFVWRYDGTTWTRIGGQGINGSWSPNTYEQVLSMTNYKGNLYVGLGTSANDAEVWKWDGSTWSQIGGDSLNSGWTTNFEEVDSMAADDNYLYAGLGASANDAEVWRWDGTSWSKIGGDSINSGWTTNYERVSSLAFYHGKLIAGLGSSAGDGEAWQWDGTSWTKIGGDSVNSGWDNTIEQVESFIPYNDKLYAGLGNSTGDAQIWEWDGTAWTKMGGDDVNSSWTSGTYERVKTLAVYNGDLYAGLGSGAGDGEVWQYNNGTWTKVAGNGINGGWTNSIEEVESFSPYKGKFYAGTGLSANADANVWSWGNNAYLQSSTSSFDTTWHHIAATYDGTTMKIYIDGNLDASKNVGITMPDGTRPLLVGSTYGGREYGKSRGYFEGLIDELRISNIARTSFTTKPYTTSDQTITLNNSVYTSGVASLDSFASNETLNGGNINYRLSTDNGSTWKYWNGSSWQVSSTTSSSNPASVINSNINSLTPTFYGIKWQAILSGDGTNQVTLNSNSMDATSDLSSPDTNASAIQANKTNGGSSLTSNAWTNSGSPYFSWTAGSDTGSGIYGYCLYLGQSNTADPVTTKGLLGTSPLYTANHCQFIVSSTNIDLATAGILGTALSTSNTPYYLIIKAIDKGGNVYGSDTQFQFRFDNTPPSNPGYITAPSGFINTKSATLTWPTFGVDAASDNASGIVGLQYRISPTGTWYGDSHSGTGDINDLLVNDGSYATQDPPDYDNLIEGINTIYFRTWDAAGNVSSSTVTAALKVNTSGAPSEPQNASVTPSTNTSNSFAFNWDVPSTFVGDANNISYCYTVNTLPSVSTCNFTSNGVTSLGAGPYATQPGVNTFYIVGRDESNNINYTSYSSVDFTANTPSPGLPTNTDIVDVSIKATSKWRLAITWDEPGYTGAGISSYKVYRSTDNNSFSFVGSSSSNTYIDAGLTQQIYYYKITACDSTNNCSAYSSTVSMLPTGKFTEPASLTSEPVINNITTSKAEVSWSTDRNSDSKVALGTSSGHYGASEVGNSSQTTSHKISLDNLSAGTTYYLLVKWTDEDGNTGSSQEYSFSTSPAPQLKEISTSATTLSSALVQFTSKGATNVVIYYGKSENFGGVKSINTSLTESKYSFSLPGLDDGTKYFYLLSAFDSEGTEYKGNVFSFSTPPRPKISNLRFQPKSGEPTSTQIISWDTNVPTSSTLNYGLVGNSGLDIQESKLKTKHEIEIKGLQDDSKYFLIASGRDKDGNLSSSDRQLFKTALDTRPPLLSEITSEVSIKGTGAEARGQVVVSWKSDEPSTSQVAFAEGADVTTFNNRTPEDTKLTTEHLVIVSDLQTSKLYSVKPVSRDKAGNESNAEVQSAIIGKSSDSILTIIFNTLQKIFGF